jgi:V/A-type H+-transporting ATPase subunit I
MDLLLYHKEQEKFLDELREQGVVHITSDAPVEGAAVQELTQEVQRIHRIAVTLRKVQKERNLTISPAEHHDVPGLIATYEECESKKDRLEQDLLALMKDSVALAPWGNFEPKDVKRLAEFGILMKLYIAAEKVYDKIDKSKYRIEVINSKDGMVYFAVLFSGEAPEVPSGAEEARLPDISLIALNTKIDDIEKQLAHIAGEVDNVACNVDDIENYLAAKTNKLRFENARLSMTSGAGGKLLQLSGWVPEKDEAKLKTFLEKFPAYVQFRDPTPDDNVPVKLANRSFSRLFEPILGLYSLPGYRETDAAMFVAPFFSLFVGLCLGDAGYGAVIMLVSLIGMFKVGPKMRPFMALGLTFGFSAILCGTLMNTFFGMNIFGGPGVTLDINGKEIEGAFALFATDADKFSPLSAVAKGNGTVYPTMSLALVLGFVQVFLGMFIQSYVQMRERGFFAGLQPLSTILIAFGGVTLGAHIPEGFLGLKINKFMVGPWKIGEMLTLIPEDAARYMALGGIAMLLLFNNWAGFGKIYIKPLQGLWAIYNFLTGFISNALSYLRLFALGLAGGLLGGAINQIAFMFIPVVDGKPHFASVGVVATVLLLVGGHTLNMGLACLSGFVHPLRLTFVEFYGAMGFKGGSKPYVPFANAGKQ